MCKRICVSLCSVMLAVLLLTPAYGIFSDIEQKDLQAKIEDMYQKDSIELQALKALLEDKEQYAVAETGGSAQGTTLIRDYNIDAARKVYFSETLMLTVFEETKSIDTVFTEEYQWLVPINGTDNQVAVFTVKDGEPRFIGIKPMKGYYISDAVLCESISKSDMDLDAIISVKYLYSELHHTTFAVIYTNSVVYAIPFVSNTDFSELENQKVYIADDMMRFLLEKYDEEKLLENPDSNGGVPLREQITSDGIPRRILNPLLLIIVLVFSSIAIGVSVYNLKNSAKRQKRKK